MLPWEVDDMPYDVYTYWQQVIGTYRRQNEQSQLALQKRSRGK
jgi:hypothetical protein